MKKHRNLINKYEPEIAKGSFADMQRLTDTAIKKGNAVRSILQSAMLETYMFLKLVSQSKIPLSEEDREALSDVMFLFPVVQPEAIALLEQIDINNFLQYHGKEIGNSIVERLLVENLILGLSEINQVKAIGRFHHLIKPNSETFPSFYNCLYDKIIVETGGISVKKVEMTLAYFVKDKQILLPLKKKKIGKGKHNGVGGRLEKGETHEQAMIRECVEEVGLKPIEYEYAAEISFNQMVDGERSIAVVHVYICKEWEGALIETDEMQPFWFNLDNIPYENMMDDDKYWLHLVLAGKKIVASFDLDENYVTLNHSIEETKSLKNHDNF